MFGLPKFGAGLGFSRLLRFVRERGIDLDRLSERSVVVTGSKGKGSTAALAAAALAEPGLRIGLFTSPHLYDVTERVRIAGSPIPPARFEALRDEGLAFARRLAAEGDGLGEFELLFLVALLWFDAEAPDAVVWEAGIGGRYDATRLLRPALGALTSVEREHAELLGPTLELIACDKLDAVRPGGRAVVSPSVPAALDERLRAYGQVSGRQVDLLRERFRIEEVRLSPEGTRFRLFERGGADREVAIGPIGLHQAENAVAAFALALGFAEERGRALEPDDALARMRAVGWPGRLERISAEPPVWIDAAHTPGSAEAACRAFRALHPGPDGVAVLGVSAGKDAEGIAAAVASHFGEVVVAQARKNGLPATELARIVSGRTAPGQPVAIRRICPTVREAVGLVREIGAREGKPVLVVGGLFLAAEFATAWRGGDPDRLVFF